MTELPEKIWATYDHDIPTFEMACADFPFPHVQSSQYIRADTHDFIVKAADELAEALKTALDYASDASKGYLWHETKKDGHDALARLSADTGKDDIETFNAALTAYKKARGETQ